MKPVSRYSLVGCALLLLLGVSLFVAAPRTRGQSISGQSTTSNWVSPFQKIEQNARAEDPNNAASVRALVDAVFDYSHSLGQAPAALEESIKERLTRSEIAYLQGNQPGVRQGDVVKLFNELGVKLNAPDFATTSLRQMRHLRMQSMLDMPAFMGRGVIPEGMINGQTISGIMSPIQATHLFIEMAELKLIDPNYQLAPVDWEKHQNQIELQRWQLAKAKHAIGDTSPIEPQGLSAQTVGGKSAQLANAMNNGWSALSADSTAKILAGCLKTLGIQ